MPDYVINISEPGYNHTDGDAHLIFSSQYPTLKIFASGSWSTNVTATSIPGVVTIPHRLGYKPMFFVFGPTMDYDELTPSLDYSIYPQSLYIGLQAYNTFDTDMDEDTLTITVDINQPSASFPLTFTGFYIIFYDPSV
jgi:hypothetical protein